MVMGASRGTRRRDAEVRGRARAMRPREPHSREAPRPSRKALAWLERFYLCDCKLVLRSRVIVLSNGEEALKADKFRRVSAANLTFGPYRLPE
jgi:hypothetical protein